ncbi:amidohydrolase [Phytohabitans sp. ZYX-F-186]|uniref:Amidohydrolase n=1 Tax=Phytohabitans maris TaxID=3071409 RepID=A0ABU0Z9D2_9ACTN|nr:amidohydrolase [Phytohabitans sp. ZYX-F-186]MDQ7903649.1 amidohydrolase [Phytohabitans sp. ZYX-F-186]
MLVADGRVTAVGGRAELRAAAPAGTGEVEALGTVVPGFLDSHLHTLTVGVERRRLVIAEAGSIPEVCERIGAWLAERPGLDWVVVGAHFHAEDLAEGRLPDRYDLDKVTGDTAVVLDRRTHDAIANSAALRRAGVDERTPDPAGGRIERDRRGTPTGILVERPAAELVLGHVPPLGHGELRAALAEAQPYLHGLGITSATEPGLVPGELRVYRAAAAEGWLTLRTTGMPLARAGVPLDDLLAWPGGDCGRLTRGPLKIYLDGAGGFGTALISRPWPGRDGAYHGNLTCPEDTFAALVAGCAERGHSVAVHAVGDAAVTLALDHFERVDARHPIAPLRFSIMHSYLWPSPADMARAARLGVLLSSQPSMQWRVGAGIADQFGDGVPLAPLRDWLDAGVTVAGGSDGPDFPMAPLFGMWQARGRRVRGRPGPLGPEQAVTAAEALAMYTTSAAYYCFAEHERGRLAPGYLADWAELPVDPLTAPLAELAEAAARPVARTVVGGTVVHGPDFE